MHTSALLQEHASLQPWNTFHVPARARWLATVSSQEDIQHLLTMPVFQETPRLFIGAGSNILFTQDYAGLVIRHAEKGIQVIEENDQHITLRIAAGEQWHDLVTHCVRHQYHGIENLALIPGSVGAAPVQNIGAYGVEIKDTLQSVSVIDTTTLNTQELDNAACLFGYRDSLFKQQPGRYWVTHITLQLSKTPIYHTQYPALEKALSATAPITIQRIYEAVIRIRQSKLPDPDQYPNAGSFFKNPLLTPQQWAALPTTQGPIPHYPGEHGQVKVPAAWLIEKAQLKGVRHGDVGTYPLQPLVIVNYAKASGQDILSFSQHVQEQVNHTFGVLLEPEVQIL